MRAAPPIRVGGRKWCRRQARACPGVWVPGSPSYQEPREPKQEGMGGRGGQRAGNLQAGCGTGEGGSARSRSLCPPPHPECLEIARSRARRTDPGAGRQRDSPSSPPAASRLTPASGLLPGPVHHRRSRRRRLSPGPPGRPQRAPSHVSDPLNVRPSRGRPAKWPLPRRAGGSRDGAGRGLSRAGPISTSRRGWLCPSCGPSPAP